MQIGTEIVVEITAISENLDTYKLLLLLLLLKLSYCIIIIIIIIIMIIIISGSSSSSSSSWVISQVCLRCTVSLEQMMVFQLVQNIPFMER
jgi:hypothetical protein